MVLRLLLRYLANNEMLVQRLAESYLIRRAARMAVSVFYKSRMLAEDKGLKELSPEKFKEFLRTFKSNLKEELEGAKEEMKRRKF